MNVGMMWFNDSPKTGLDKKLQEAAAYYQEKYGRRPNLCMVHQGTLAQFGTAEAQFGDLKVKEMKGILPGHLWIGIDDSKESSHAGD